MSNTDTNAARRGSESNDLLGVRSPGAMKAPNGFWSHEQRSIGGWQQLGDIHGAVFGCWFQPPNSAISIGDESGRYWLRIGNCYHGSHMTPEDAAKKARDILQRDANEETPNVF